MIESIGATIFSIIRGRKMARQVFKRRDVNMEIWNRSKPLSCLGHRKLPALPRVGAVRRVSACVKAFSRGCPR